MSQRQVKKRARFRVLDVHSRAGEAFDDRGRVRIYIRRIDATGKFVKGNVARSLTVADVTVEEIFQHIREGLR